MYKVVFFDVDGTLLSEIDRSMHESTKEAIQRLIEKGIHVVVTTGDHIAYVRNLKSWAYIQLFLQMVHISSVGNQLYINQYFQVKLYMISPEFAELHGHGISYFTEDFAMNGIASDNERVMQALSETLNLEGVSRKKQRFVRRNLLFMSVCR
ncbi:HAD hydrolase family protein [Bacillus paranthracis]